MQNRLCDNGRQGHVGEDSYICTPATKLREVGSGAPKCRVACTTRDSGREQSIRRGAIPIICGRRSAGWPYQEDQVVPNDMADNQRAEHEQAVQNSGGAETQHGFAGADARLAQLRLEQ